MAATKRPTTKTSSPRKTAAKNTAASTTSATAAAEKAASSASTAVKVVRDAAHATIGAPLFVQDRIVRRDFTTPISSSEFLEQAKTMGHERVVQIQDLVEPYVKRVVDRLEPITDRIESSLPTQVQHVIETGRDRMRELLAV